MAEADPDNPFYCAHCFVHCTSAVDLQSHLRGSKHAGVLAGRRAPKMSKTTMVALCRPPSAPVVPLREKTLEDYLDASITGEPAIGLEYIYEHWSGTPTPAYTCKLCQCHTQARDMFMHIMGYKHRQAYLTDQQIAVTWIKGKGQDLHTRVKELAQEVEQKYGRQKIHVISVDSGEEGKRKSDGDRTERRKSQQRDVTSSEPNVQPAPVSSNRFSLIPSKRFPMRPSKWFPLRLSNTFPSRPSKRSPSRPITRSPTRRSKRSTSRYSSRRSKRSTSRSPLRRSKSSTSRASLRRSKRSTSRDSTRSPLRRSKRSTSRSPLRRSNKSNSRRSKRSTSRSPLRRSNRSNSRRSKRSTSRSSTRSYSRPSKRSTSRSSSRSSTRSSSSSSTGSHSDSSTTSSSSSTTASSGQAQIVLSQELQKPQTESKQNKNKLDDFRSNQEFFEYLKEFEISCEDDAVFLVKVTQMFMQLLFEYQLKSQKSPEAAVSPRDSNSTQQTSAASSTGQHMYTEYPPKMMSVQQPPVATAATYWEDANRSAITEYPQKSRSVQQPPVPTATTYWEDANRSGATEYPPKTMSSQQPPVPTATTYWAGSNRSAITEYPPKTMSSQQPPVPTASTYWANARRSVITEYPPRSMFGQQPPVSTALTCWANANRSFTSTKPFSESIHVGASSKEIMPSLPSVHAVQERSNLENTMDNPESDYRCYLCGALDHHVRDCPTSAYAGLGPVPIIQQQTGIPRRVVGVEDPKTLSDIGTSTMLPVDTTPRTPLSEPPKTTTNLAKANASDEDKIGVSVRQSGYINDYMKKTGSNLFITCQYCGKQGHHKFQCPFIGIANLAEVNASEEDKIRAVMCQSAYEYDPVNFGKLKQQGILRPGYICYRCKKPGHHIKYCPTLGAKSIGIVPVIRKCTGIPKSFMVEVSDPSMKGAMVTSSGKYAIQTIDAAVYAMEKPEDPASSTADDKPTPAKHRIIAAGIMSSHVPNLPPQ